MSTALIRQAATMGTRICNLSVSTSTTIRPRVSRKALEAAAETIAHANRIGDVLSQEASTCPARCWWTSSRAPWTPSGPAPTARSSGRTTSCSGSAERATTGPRATTRRAQSWWTRFSTWSARRQRDVIAYR